MKWIQLLAAVMLLAGAGIARAADERAAKPLVKGVELYSWKTDAGDWLFVLAEGTNRLKTEAEIKTTKTVIKGTADLKKAVARLAVGEHVSWTHHIKGFAHPDAATRKEIAQAAKDAKVELYIDTKD